MLHNVLFDPNNGVPDRHDMLRTEGVISLFDGLKN